MSVNKEFEKTLALLIEQVPRVLEGARVRATSREWETSSDAILGTVGFGGVDLRGSFLLIGSTHVWREIAPALVAFSDASDALLCDMVAELCNMIVGRFKNRLLRLGIELACGTPSSAYGHLALPRLPRALALHIDSQQIETPAGNVYLRVDFLFGDHFAFPTDVVGGIEPAEADLFF